MSTDVPAAGSSAGRPWWRWLFVVPGLAAVAWGAAGLLRSSAQVPLGSWAVWFVGGAVVHDLVVAPLVIGVGALLARVLPGEARAPVVAGLVVSGPLLLVGGLFALNPGDVAEPGFLPLPYGRNLVVVVGAVLAVAAALAVTRTRRARRTGRQPRLTSGPGSSSG